MQYATSRASEFQEPLIFVAPFLRDIQPLLEERAAARGTALAIERAPADLRIRGHEGALQQILLNLVDTATRCVVAGSTLRMWCESNAQVVAVRMRCGACHGLHFIDQALISATREVAQGMDGDVKVAVGLYTVELPRTT